MKSLKVLVMLCIAAPLLFSTCKKDDEDTRKNAFTFHDVEYNIDGGIIEYYGKWTEEGGYNLDVTLFTPGLSYNETTNEIAGTGSYMYFEMYSTADGDLADGTYTYDEDETGAGGTFDIGYIVLGYDSETETGYDYYVSGGTIEFQKLTNNYKFTINITVEGNILDGYYKGQLTQINFKKSLDISRKKRF